MRGHNGVNGRPGKNGAPGQRGPQGPQGPRGAVGKRGQLGRRGARGPRGKRAPTSHLKSVVGRFNSMSGLYHKVIRRVRKLSRMRSHLIQMLGIAKRRYAREQEEKRKRAAVLKAARIAAAKKLKAEHAAAARRKKARTAKRAADDKRRKAQRKQREAREARIAKMKRLLKAANKQRLHGMFELRAVHADKCVSINEASARSGSKLVLQNCRQYRHQVFMWTKDKLSSVLNGMCVAIKRGSMRSGALLVMQQCRNFKAQRWELSKKGHLKSALNRKCVDLYARRTSVGTPVVMWKCHNGNNQVFALRRISVARQVPMPGYRFRGWCKSVKYRKGHLNTCYKMGPGWVWVGLCKKYWFRKKHLSFCTPQKPCAKCKFGVVKRQNKRNKRKNRPRTSRRRRRMIQKIVKKILKAKPAKRGPVRHAGAKKRRTNVRIRKGGRGCPNRLISFHKKAEQSSTGHGGRASRAVDGNTNGNYGRLSCSHTRRTNNPWWNVDLGQVRTISRVIVWNRQDCCTSRLNHFKVRVALRGKWRTCGSVRRARRKNTIPCGCRAARYVRVQLERRGYLTLCEVQVFGG